ncbi:serine/threonine-protein phosphatase 6 regulatory subunit 3 [Amborella trichopoda]|uniref:serine/threonine-protein phosphatase 6 regulatory subunit 3 n=1 Tax=Amborella trichopoda TaxID=13333 RepID=UPI0005D43D19|nr:serine/threonine-protein phosphatase 6 regulatory subunit 3 [Amborella trichopoda]|eukprot:XP_006846781.2 serine/threonine-protein phosphatase 6 regulatory subunit 3 [Amborella trichopoda]
MFWHMTGLSAASPVESVLDKENFTLEELFDEEEIIQECKALNSRLINFLRDRAQVKQMLHYIVEDPPEDSEKRRAYKFPFVACEIFTCEIDVILKTLVEDEELMNLLFSFLEPNRSHCTLLAGYFSKVVVCLMLRKTIPLMNYVQAHQEIFGRLVDLIGITSIMEVLVRLVGADDHMYTNFTDVMQWLADTNLLEMIADKLSPSNSPEVHANAAETLCAITRNSSSALAAKISTPSFVGRIFGHALEHAPSRSSLVHSLSVCISLLDPRRAALAPPGHLIRGQHLFDPPFSANPETVSGMLLKLGDLLMLLNVSSDESVLPTTYGELCPPLGKHRLKIVEFIAVLLRTGSDIAEKELVSSGAIHRILDLFFEFPFNNSLHHHVESIIMSCLESKNSTLIDHLFKECDLIGKVLSADKNPTLSSDTNGPTMPAPGRPSPRIGNIGHLTRMANKLVQLGNSNSQVQAYLQENGEWIEWHANVLLKRNTVENVYQWTCGRPSSLQDRMRDSDEDDIRDRDYDVAALANNLSQAFRYGMYENDDGEEVHGSLDRDEEDVYFDDDSAEVVISSLRLGDDQENGCLFTNSNWFAFQDDRIVDEPLSTSQPSRMEEINLNGTEGTVNSGGSSSSDDEVVVGEDEELLDTANSSERRSLSWVTENGLSNGRDPSSLTANLEKAGTSDVSLFGSDQCEGETSGVRSPVDWVAWQGELGKGGKAFFCT